MSQRVPSPIEPYAPLQPLDPASSVWVSEGEWQKTIFKRRMTVMRLKSGGLLVHNPFRLHAPDLARLRDLGPVVGIIAPNTLHDSDTPWMAAQFPSAKVFCPERSIRKLRRIGVREPQAFEAAWPAEWSEEVLCLPVQGLRIAGEAVFLHRASRTLILTDLAFNLRVESRGLEAAFLRWNLIDNRFGPSRIFRWIFLRDRNAFSQSIRQLLGESFDRVVVNHGQILEEDAHSVFERAFGPLLIG